MAKIGVREQQATEDLQKVKDEWDATINKLEKEISKLKNREVVTRKSDIEEYKSFNGFYEPVVQATSKYIGEGFDLCKKHISFHHPEFDIQGLEIDDELARVKDESEDEKEEEDDEEEKERGRASRTTTTLSLNTWTFFLAMAKSNPSNL